MITKEKISKRSFLTQYELFSIPKIARRLKVVRGFTIQQFINEPLASASILISGVYLPAGTFDLERPPGCYEVYRLRFALTYLADNVKFKGIMILK